MRDTRILWYAICLLASWRAHWSAQLAAIQVLPLIPFGIWVCRCHRHRDANSNLVWIYLFARKCWMATRCPHAPNARHVENAPRVSQFSVSPNISLYVSASRNCIKNVSLLIMFPLLRSQTLLRDSLEQTIEYCRVSHIGSWAQHGLIWRKSKFECALFALCDLQSYGWVGLSHSLDIQELL